MLIVVIAAVFIALAMGLVIKAILDRTQSDNQISWLEFAIVAVVMAVIITPTTMFVGKKLSVNNIVTYEQFLNGVETRANDIVTTCFAGHSGTSASAGQSNCDHSYISGSYTWMETYYVQVCTGSGDNQSCHQEPRQRPESAYIYTPYATREHHYTIESSFGFKANSTYHFSESYLDEHPVAYGNKEVPGDLPKGPPKSWVESKQHLDAGDPLPVTALGKYDNYILASDDAVLKEYSSDIETYREAELLPDFAANITQNPIGGRNNSHADKVAFVGTAVTDEAAWQKSVMQFNAALGLQLQGDLHVVVVSDSVVTANNAVNYTRALKAHWQDASVYGKRALAKNAIVLVLGTDGSTVTWAQSTTGMPFGNELMAQYVQDWLPGTALNPQAIFGSPRTVLRSAGDMDHPEKMDPDLTLSTPRGAFEKIVFEDAPFARASMSCNDDGDGCVGFANLVDTIEPHTWQKVVMVLITSFIAGVLWCIAGVVSLGETSRKRASYSPYNYRRF